MKQELLDLIDLNTYIDYSANKASEDDISELLSKCGMILPDDYLNFLRQLNGFQLYKLSLYGTRVQPKIPIFDAWHLNQLRRPDHPSLNEYFVLGEGYEELYCYYPADKKYYILEFYDEHPTKGQVFEDFDSFIDWAIKRHAKRTSEQKKIIEKDALLHIANRVTDFLASHNFKKTSGDIPDNMFSYERQIPLATEWIGFSIQVSQERDLMYALTAASKRYHLIEDFFDPEDLEKTAGGIGGAATINLLTAYPNVREQFSEQKVNEDPEALAAHFISFIGVHIFPALALYDNVRVLDAKVNSSLESFMTIGPIAGRGYFVHYKMVIGRLAGNPIYDEIFRFIKERFENAVRDEPDGEKKYRGYLEVTLKLNDKLQKVSPLKDGMLVRITSAC
jgi:hypothetical protein